MVESPALRQIRAVWTACQAEQATAADVLEVLQQVAGFIQYELHTLAAQLENGMSDANDPVYCAVVAAFQKHYQAVEQMAAAVDADAFEAGLALAEEATQELMAAHRRTMEHIESLSRITCMFCRQETSRGQDRCEHCGRALPASSSEVATSSFDALHMAGLEVHPVATSGVTENFAAVAQAVEAWKCGELDAAGLLDVVNQVEEKTRAHQQDCLRQRDLLKRAPEAIRATLERGVGMTEAGLCDTIDALQTMREALIIPAQFSWRSPALPDGGKHLSQ